MNLLENLKAVFSEIIDFYAKLNSKKWVSLFLMTLATFIFSYLITLLFSEIEHGLFDMPVDFYDLPVESNSALNFIYRRTSEIIALTLLTLGLLSPYYFTFIAQKSKRTFVEFLTGIKSAKWALYFLVVVLIVCIYMFPAITDYNAYNDLYSYTSWELSHWQFIGMDTIRRLIPVIGLLGAYLLVQEENFSFTQLINRKKSLVALLLLVTLISSLINYTIIFMDNYFANLFSIFFDSSMLMLLFLGVLKLFIVLPLTAAKMVIISSKTLQKDDVRTLKIRENDELIDL